MFFVLICHFTGKYEIVFRQKCDWNQLKIGLVCQMQKKWKSHIYAVLTSASTSSYAISILFHTTRLILHDTCAKKFFFFYRILLIYCKCEMFTSPKHGTINRYSRMTRLNSVYDESWNIVWHPNCMCTHLIATLIFIFSLLWISLSLSFSIFFPNNSGNTNVPLFLKVYFS